MCTDLRSVEEIDWSYYELSEELYWKMLEDEEISKSVNELHRGTKE